MDEIQAAWLAGLIEGEGYVQNRAGKGVTMGVTMCDLDVIERVHKLTGVGTVRSYRVRDPEKHRQTYCWRVCNLPQIQEIIRAIYQHMGERRRAKFDEVLARKLTRPSYRRDERGGATVEPCGNPECSNVVRRQAWHRKKYRVATCSVACTPKARQAVMDR